MKSCVSRVACMRLLDCGPSLAHLTPSGVRMTTPNLCYAIRYPPPSRLGRTRWLATIQSYAFATRHSHAFSQQMAIAQQQSNARHHPPPSPAKEYNNPRVGGRVHAVVRLRPSLARLPPPGSRAERSNLRHALRHWLASRSGRPSRPATLSPDHFVTRHGRASQLAKGYNATAI
jgi:hypothetical protein